MKFKVQICETKMDSQSYKICDSNQLANQSIQTVCKEGDLVQNQMGTDSNGYKSKEKRLRTKNHRS